MQGSKQENWDLVKKYCLGMKQDESESTFQVAVGDMVDQEHTTGQSGFRRCHGWEAGRVDSHLLEQCGTAAPQGLSPQTGISRQVAYLLVGELSCVWFFSK